MHQVTIKLKLKEKHLRCYKLDTISVKLKDYLADVNEQATDMFFRLVKQMAERDDIF